MLKAIKLQYMNASHILNCCIGQNNKQKWLSAPLTLRTET